MKRVFLLTVLCAFSALASTSIAQSASTKIIRLEIDGKEVKADYHVYVATGNKEVEAVRVPTGFVLPEEVRSLTYLDVAIVFGKHRLDFWKVHISNFEEDWVVGIDNKPFSARIVSKEKAKQTKRAYYIKFLGGEPERLLVMTEKKS